MVRRVVAVGGKGAISRMGLLEKIVASVLNDPAPVIAVALAAFIGVVGASIWSGLWRLVVRTIPRGIRYKCWPFFFGLYIKSQIKYRSWKAKRVMETHLQPMNVRIERQAFETCLAEGPRNSTARRLEGIRPPEPKWLNDYYMANALEILSRDCKIVKAREYQSSGWPPDIVNYRFWLRRTDRTPGDEAREYETDGKCRAYQRFHECPVGQRFEAKRCVETVAVHRTRDAVYLVLKDQAPPCAWCWETVSRNEDIRWLVLSITDREFAKLATKRITGEDQEFQEVVIMACSENKVASDVQSIKDIVARGIEIRREQLESVGLGASTEWTEQQTAEFSDALDAYIQDGLTGHDGWTDHEDKEAY